MAGELHVASAGQNATIEFHRDTILVRFPSYFAARKMVSNPIPHLDRFGKLLKFGEVSLRAQVGKRQPFELFPAPSWIVKLLSPSIRAMVDDTNF